MRFRSIAAALVAAALLAFGASSARAQTCPLPYTFTNGAIADANQINAQFTALVNCQAAYLGHVANNVALKNHTVVGLSTTSVLDRDGFSAPNDGGAMRYRWSTTPCSLASGAGDNGSQVAPNSGGGCWLAGFLSPGPDIRQFGADPTGTSDSTAAANACLAAAAGGTCRGAGGVYKFLGDVTIPANTTLDMGATFPDLTLSGPRILLSASQSILFGGVNAALKNFLIVPTGMAFPQSGSSAWTGTALNTQGNGSVQIEDGEIVGFDVCLNGYGTSRPVYKHVYMDCNGGAASGGTGSPPTSATLITGNEVDAGFIEDVKLQVVGTAATCPNRERQGTGWYSHDSPSGGVFADNIVVQDYQTANYYLKNYNNFMAGRIWADYDTAGGCVAGASISAVLDNVNAFHADHISINGTATGIIAKNAGSSGQSIYIEDLFLNFVQGDCVVLGSAGQVSIGLMRTNAAAGCGAYAVNYVDAISSTVLKILQGSLYDVHGGASPYIYNNYNVSPGVQLQLGNIVTDLPAGSALVGGAIQPNPPTIASAATLALAPNQCSFMCAISGTTNITSLSGVSSGDIILLEFQGVLTLVNGNNIEIPGGINFTTSAGSIVTFACNSFNGSVVVCTVTSTSPPGQPSGALNLTGQLTSATTLGSNALSMANVASGLAGTPAGLFSGYPMYLFSSEGGWTGPSTASIVGGEFDLKITSATDNSSTYTALVGQCDLYTVVAYVSGHTLGCQGIFGIGAILKNQGGTLGAGASGQVWGVAAIAELYNDGTDPPTGIISVSNEFDVIMPTGTSANNRYGLNAVDFGSAVQGATEDAAYVISALTGSIGFKNGILFSSNGGGIPMSSDGSVLTSLTSAPLAVTYGIDLNNFTVSQQAFRGPGGTWEVDGAGNQITQTLRISALPGSGGSGGLFLCADSTGATYKNSTCP